jgi:uridine kinase
MTFTIGIAGGTGAGKTTLANTLLESFGDRAVLLAHDAYYRDLSSLTEAERAATNFDAPESLETELLAQHLDTLSSGDAVSMPVYDFATHSRLLDSHREVHPAPITIVEGILLFSDDTLDDRLNLKVFVEADADERILRRIRRDVEERGRSVSSVMEQYLTTVKPMHDRYVEPSRSKADLVVNGRGEMGRAVELIVAHVEARLADG